LSTWILFGPTERRELHSPLSLEACRDKLRAEIGSAWNPFSGWSHAVRGSVSDKGFWIVKTKGYRNSFETEARGTWSAEGNGTRIELRLGVNRWARGIMIAWFGFVLLLWIWLLVAARPMAGELRGWHLGPGVMLLLGALAVPFGRWLARNEGRFLLGFLRRTLECPPDPEPIA